MTHEQKGPFDLLYGSSKEHVFGNGEPEAFVATIPTHRSAGSVLDIGSGDGRNALYLASKGFDVTAVDTSEVAIDKLKRFADEKNISIESTVGDITKMSLDRNFDVIVSTFVLQYLTTEDAMRVLQDMKARTNAGGLNSVTLFTKNGDFFRRKHETVKFYPDEGWLKEFYNDWEIIQYKESETEALAVKEDGHHMKNVTARILARKPSKRT